MKHSVTFQPSGRRCEVEEGEALLDAARAAGERINALCGGQGVCGKCKVVLADGELGPAGRAEHGLLKPTELAGGFRLACQATVQSDSVVNVPEGSGTESTVVLGADACREVAVDPVARNLYIEPGPAVHGSPGAEAEKVKASLRVKYGMEDASFTLPALKSLHGIMAESEGRLTACVRDGLEVVRIAPGYAPGLFGASFDVGTTTIAAMLCELETGRVLASDAMTNPLVVMGDDVLSRVSYAVSHAGGLDAMRGLLIDALNDMLEAMTGRSGGDGPGTSDEIMETVLVGNTVMHHILLGLPTVQLGVSPFVPAVSGTVELTAAESGLSIHAAGRVYVPPVVGGFVGADTTAVMAALWPFEKDITTLVADLGTNGELVLVHEGGVLAASCATGPALEGAQISSGMRAAPGAVEKAVVDPDSGEVSYRVVGSDVWSTPGRYSGARGICGSGIIDIVAGMMRAGLIDRGGRILLESGSQRVRPGQGGEPEFVVAQSSETASGNDIALTQSDIRAVQLAKAAVAAGVGILMEESGVAGPYRLVVAGAFGNYLDIWNAVSIGMFPGCDPKNALQAGNAAGDGARALLLSADKRAEVARLAGCIKYLELSTHPDFQKRFLEAMSLP